MVCHLNEVGGQIVLFGRTAVDMQFQAPSLATKGGLNESVFGDGLIRHSWLNSGIILATLDRTFEAPASIEFPAPKDIIGIGFSLSGTVELKVDGKSLPHSFNPGWSNLTCFPPDAEVSLTVGCGLARRVCLTIPLETLNGYAERSMRSLHGPLNLKNHSTYHATSLTPGMRVAVSQLLSCPYQGMTKGFFIESKVMELLAYKFKQLGNSQPVLLRTSLSSRDVEGVHHAAKLLTENLEHPKSLKQIAREVGMCRSKLHEAFRTVHGVTPFEYQRDYRLEVARQYLLEGRMNITETAFAVGYSCSGYFTKAFKKRFGHLPGQCLNNSAVW